MPEITRHLIIEGRVQGVGFRWSMAREANRLGLKGWVRNRRDGTVEADICGEEAAVISLLAWSQKGPPEALVNRVTVEIGTFAPTGTAGFEQIANA